MELRLSELELRALSALCAGGSLAGELAAKINAKKSLVSRLLASLQEAGLIIVERQGTTKHVSLSLAAHAQAFKRLRDSRPDAKIGKWLSGAALDALVVMAWGEGAPMSRLERECDCSKTTLYRVLRSLRGAGVVSFDGRAYRVSDQPVAVFANAFADCAQQSTQNKLGGRFRVSIRVRKHVVVRTDAKKVPPFFSLTGLPFFVEKGVDAVRADYSDYYFHLDEKPPRLSIEARFVHAVLISTVELVNKPLLAVVLKRFKFDAVKLRELSEFYAVTGELNELRTAVSYHEKLRDYE